MNKQLSFRISLSCKFVLLSLVVSNSHVAQGLIFPKEMKGSAVIDTAKNLTLAVSPEHAAIALGLTSVCFFAIPEKTAHKKIARTGLYALGALGLVGSTCGFAASIHRGNVDERHAYTMLGFSSLLTLLLGSRLKRDDVQNDRCDHDELVESPSVTVPQSKNIEPYRSLDEVPRLLYGGENVYQRLPHVEHCSCYQQEIYPAQLVLCQAHKDAFSKNGG